MTEPLYKWLLADRESPTQRFQWPEDETLWTPNAKPILCESGWHGMEERDPEAAKAALKNEIVENQVLGRSVLTPEEQMENRARQQDPDLFAKYDAINDRMQTLRETIARFREPVTGTELV